MTMNTSLPILVTGAAGYLASWIVEQLLGEGFAVNGTVRSLRDAARIQHLQELAAKHPGRLQLFEADLLAPGSFDAAMAGCSAVIHAASPYFIEQPRDPLAQLVQPALEGTKNVFSAVARTATVRRVVVTSSVAALYNDARDVDATAMHTVQEADVNRGAHLHHNPYAYSKTLAERAAWELQKQQDRWDLITIHPGAIFGPSLARRVDATSVQMVIQFLNGSFRSGVPKLWLGTVDVRDVAAAHVRAVTHRAARGRYIVVAESLRLLEISKLLRVEAFGIPDKLPKSEVPKALMWLIAPLAGMQRNYVSGNVGHPLRFNSERSRAELDLRYRMPAETFNDHILQLVRDDLLKPAKLAAANP